MMASAGLGETEFCLIGEDKHKNILAYTDATVDSTKNKLTKVIHCLSEASGR